MFLISPVGDGQFMLEPLVLGSQGADLVLLVGDLGAQHRDDTGSSAASLGVGVTKVYQREHGGRPFLISQTRSM